MKVLDRTNPLRGPCWCVQSWVGPWVGSEQFPFYTYSPEYLQVTPLSAYVWCGELWPNVLSGNSFSYLPFFPEDTELSMWRCLITAVFIKLCTSWDIYVFLDSFFNFSLILELFYILFFIALFRYDSHSLMTLKSMENANARNCQRIDRFLLLVGRPYCGCP